MNKPYFCRNFFPTDWRHKCLKNKIDLLLFYREHFYRFLKSVWRNWWYFVSVWRFILWIRFVKTVIIGRPKTIIAMHPRTEARLCSKLKRIIRRRLCLAFCIVIDNHQVHWHQVKVCFNQWSCSVECHATNIFWVPYAFYFLFYWPFRQVKYLQEAWVTRKIRHDPCKDCSVYSNFINKQNRIFFSVSKFQCLSFSFLGDKPFECF